MMNQKYTLAVGVVTIAASLAIFQITRQTPVAPAGSKSSRTTATPSGPSAGPSALATDSTTPAVRKREREPHENAELVALYGDARTNLSKHVTQNMVSLLEDAIAMGEMAASSDFKGAFGNSQNGLRGGLGAVFNDLKLNEQQIEKASELHREFQKRALAATRASINKLKENPAPLMSLMLASDASARGKITPEAFKEVQVSTAAELENVINPLDRKNFGSGKPLNDEVFSNGLREILDEDQAAVLQTSLDSSNAAAEGPKTGNITELPPMELEKLEATVKSGQAIVGGLKQAMEGMGSLHQLGPLPGVPKTNP